MTSARRAWRPSGGRKAPTPLEMASSPVSDDLPLAKHLYTTVFGFAGAGERLIYSRHNGEVMGLGGWGGASVLYMVGRQELVQLEFWTHTTPRQRPLPDDWRPNDIGFCRLGVAVADFDGSLERLAGLGVPTLTAPALVDGLRRVCFRDPTVAIPVEIMERGAGFPGECGRHHDLEPSVVYATASVPNLDEAVSFFRDVVGLPEANIELHAPDHEHLWGLPGARRRVATLRGGTVFLELAQYEWPAGRPRPLDDALDRQGLKTVAVGFRDPAETAGVFARVKAAGLDWSVPQPASHIGGNHAVGAVAHRLKTLSVPPELERQFGFSPEPPRWWSAPAPAERNPRGDTGHVERQSRSSNIGVGMVGGTGEGP